MIEDRDLSDNMASPSLRSKTYVFINEEIGSPSIHSWMSQNVEVFDTDEEDWDNLPDESASIDVEQRFQRIDSKLELVTHQSLLTELLHRAQHADTPAHPASQSTSVGQRSGTASTNDSLTSNSFESESSDCPGGPDIGRAQPILMTASTIHSPVLSPRSSRREMLASEMTESLRSAILWERRQQNDITTETLQASRHRSR